MPARNILGIWNVPPLWTANTNSPPTRSEPHAPCCAGRACDLPPRRISAKRRSANWKMARGNRIPARSQLSAGPSRAAEFCLRPKEAHPYRILKGQRPRTIEAGAGGEQTARGRILRQEPGDQTLRRSGVNARWLSGHRGRRRHSRPVEVAEREQLEAERARPPQGPQTGSLPGLPVDTHFQCGPGCDDTPPDAARAGREAARAD